MDNDCFQSLKSTLRVPERAFKQIKNQKFSARGPIIFDWCTPVEGLCTTPSGVAQACCVLLLLRFVRWKYNKILTVNDIYTVHI